MEMIRRHFLPPLAPIPYIKERLGALNPHWNLRPNIAPCPGCLPIMYNSGSTYQPSNTIQTYLSPCRANILTCLQSIGLPTYTPSANRPCLDKLCNQPHEKPLGPKPLYSNDPALKPTLIKNQDSFSSVKNSSNSVLEPTHKISSTSLPVVTETTATTSFQFTLPEKLFNLAMNPTTPNIGDTTETLEDLRKNSSILENEILEIEPFELNKHLKDSVSNLTSKDTAAKHETKVPDFTTAGRNELEITTPNYFIEQITTQKTPVPLYTLNTPKEEPKTESPCLNVFQERIDPSNMYQPFTKIVIDENVATLPTTYEVNSIKKETDQDQTSEKTNERNDTEDDSQLNTTGEPLLVTEQIVNSAKYDETTAEPSEQTIYKTSTLPVIHEHVMVTTDDTYEKVFQEQVITGDPNLDKQATTTETTGANVNVKNQLNDTIQEFEVSTKQTETTILEEYYTSSLITKLSLQKNSGVTHGLPETTTTDSLLSLGEVTFSGFHRTAQSDDFTTENGEVRTTGDFKEYEGIELERSTEFRDSLTKMDDKSEQTPVGIIEENTKSSEILEDKSNLETSVISVEITTQALKNIVTLDYESSTDSDGNSFETTTSSILYNKGAWNEENYNFYTTTDDADVYKVTAKESSDIFKEESKIITHEEEVIDNVVANYTKELNSSKINVENQTQPFGILKERDSSNNTSDSEKYTTFTPDQLTTASIAEYYETVIESKSESYPGFRDRFETTTNFEHYLEGSTQPFDKGSGKVDSTDDKLETTTVTVDSEDIFTELDDLRSSGLTGEPAGYQDGVLKFTTELDSETDASPTDNSNPPFPEMLQNTLRQVRDKPTILGRFPFSPVQSVKKCVDFLDCLVSKNRSKRSSRNNSKTLSSGKNMPSSNTNFLNLSSVLNKEKRSNVETSGLYAPALLELLPVVREGYRNNAFNEDDKKIIRSIFGDLGSQAVEENLESSKEVKGDLLMKDATARIEVLLEDDDYESSEFYGDKSLETKHRLKRSKKPFHLITSILRKIQKNRMKSSIIKASPERYRREIRSSQPLSEAAAILALLAEQSDVQLDAPDDEEDDYYEYYEDQGSVNVALGEDLSTDDQEGYENEEYDEPSFVDLIKLARRHSQRKSRQDS